ncbi:cadherin-like domain-containing protein [Polaromonas sp. P2-4]|nr:cadherin-like domain-containing protein [Polaromonas sp. P2-4]
MASGLTIRAWDRTSGTAGGRADTTSTGGTTPFSSAIGNVNITVTPVNDAPSTTPVALPAAAEDSAAITITPAQLLANAADVDGDTLSVTGLAASSGSLTANADGTWSFTPAADFTGTVSFTYSVSDGTATVAGSASLLVTPVNDAPSTAPVALPAAAEDSAAITITPAQLLANAADVDGDALTITSLAASSGSLTANADGTWSFTPAADFNGTVSFSYSVSDGTATVAGSASLLVTPVNDAPSNAPVALPAVSEDSAAITITPAQLLANAADVDGDALAITGLAASGGSLTANADGTWSFTPAADFTGTVSFSYSVSDGTATVAGSASLLVTPVNDAPSNAPVALPAVSEDSAAITITPAQLLANAADVDGDALAITGLAASSGSLSANGDGTWSFTPAADFNGTVSFTYSVSDGTAAVAGSASLLVTAVNDAPTNAPVALPAAAEDSPAITIITPAQLLANAGDVDGDALTVIGLAASSGSLSANGDGTWRFTPAADFNGTVSFSYSVSDGTATVAGSASLLVTAVNDAPTTAPVALPAAAEDSAAITITPAQLLANAADVDGDALTITSLAASSGSLSANGDGTWRFTPAADFTGTVSFTYSISDGTAAVAGSASLLVTAVNDAPTTAPVALPAAAEDSAAITITPAQLLANAADVDGDALAITGLAASSGSLSANADGTWSFTPAADFTGTVSFGYSITDGTAAVAGSASLLVTPVNDAPTNAPVALPAVSEDSAAITITPAQLLAAAGDVDGDALTVIGLAASSGSLSANGDGTWRFTPAADFTGTVSFTYSISDGTAAVAGSASLLVTAVNDAPTTAPVALPAASEDSAITITPAQLLAAAGDVDGDALTVSGLAASSGSLTANADGTWSFTPAADFNGTVSFTYPSAMARPRSPAVPA